MTQTSHPEPSDDLAAEHLAVLRELRAIAMTVTRAYGSSAAASARAVEAAIGDECWQPQTDRSLALSGSLDAADAFHKVSRVVRLTVLLEQRTAKLRRDLLSDMVQKAAGAAPAATDADADRRRPARPSSQDASDADGLDSDAERAESERLDRLPAGRFEAVVTKLRADLGLAPPVVPVLCGASERDQRAPENGAPDVTPRRDHPDPEDPAAHPPP